MTIDADGTSRVIAVYQPQINLTIEGVTISGGLASGTSTNEDGGGIHYASDATLTVDQSAIRGNVAEGDGGGIWASTGSSVIIQNSVIENNSASEGGAIRVFQTGSQLSVRSSTIANNDATIGGGISVADGAVALIDQSTISGNQTTTPGANRGGGGLFAFLASVTIENSTISGNQNAARGGGLALEGGSATIRNTTIVGNTADSQDQGGDFALGGGIYAQGVQPVLTHTIVAGNQIGTALPVSGDIEGTVDSSSGFNLVGDPDTAGGLTDGDAGNIVGQDDGNGGREPLALTSILHPLSDNGGPTMTHAPVDGGPVVDSGDPTFDDSVTPNDQRGDGFVRVADGDNNDSAVIDIGAVESQTMVVLFDFGDAPNGFPVTLDDDGARHRIGTLRLGSEIDFEADGTESSDALADGDDEDGVLLIADIIRPEGTTGTRSSIAVNASGQGLLDAWIDFNGNQDWSDAGEQIADSLLLQPGSNIVTFSVPVNVAAGQAAARFRLSTSGTEGPTGEASNGEVEDYLFSIVDGATSPNVNVNLVSNQATSVLTQQGVTIHDGNDVLFSSPLNEIGELRVNGTSGNDEITLDFSGGGIVPSGGLTVSGGDGENTLAISTGDFDFEDTSVTLTQFQSIALDSIGPNRITLSVGSVQALANGSQSVAVTGGEGDEIRFTDASDWRMGQTSIVSGSFIRTIVHTDGTELQVDLPRPWQNLVQINDVDNGGMTTPLDALIILNELGRRQASGASNTLEDPTTIADWLGIYYDANGDGEITPRDALQVINQLAIDLAGTGEAEGNAPDPRIPNQFAIFPVDDPTSETFAERTDHQDDIDPIETGLDASSKPKPSLWNPTISPEIRQNLDMDSLDRAFSDEESEDWAELMAELEITLRIEN